MVVVTGGMVVETVVMVVETDVMEETGAIVGATRVVVVEDTIETGKYAIPFLSEAYSDAPIIYLSTFNTVVLKYRVPHIGLIWTLL